MPTWAKTSGYIVYFIYIICMGKTIGHNRNNSNAANKILAKQFRAQTIRPIKPAGTRHKAAYRARRSDYGSAR